MKKIFILLLAVLMFVPHYDYASAETIGSVPCPGGTGFCYYVNNPNKPNLINKLVDSRAIPVTSAPAKIGRVAGYALSLWMSTPQGQSVIKSSAATIDNLSNALGTQIQNLSDIEKSNFVNAYDVAFGVSSILNLGTSLYNSFMAKMDVAFGNTDLTMATMNADGSSTYFFNGVGYTVSAMNPVRTLGLTTYAYNNSKYYKHLWWIKKNGSYWLVNQATFIGGVYSSQFQYTDVYYTSLNDAVTGGMNKMAQDTTIGINTDYNVYKPSSDSISGVGNATAGTIALPSFPNTDTIPSISSDSDGNRYWEIPAPYTDGTDSTNYVPVDNPSATPIKGVVIVNGDGYLVDGTGAVVGDTPIVEAPAGTTTDTPTDTPTDTTGDTTTLKDILDGIIAIPSKIGEVITDLFVPSDEFFKDGNKQLQDEFNAKVPLFKQIGLFFDEISKTTVSPTKPRFTITLPENYGGGTYDIIDFSYFDEWRTWILNFIRFSMWFIFLKRLYNRIPKMIY